MLKHVLTAVFFIISTTAKAEDCDTSVLNELRRILLSNAVQDAEVSFQSGEVRFLAIYGYTYILPGLHENLSSWALKNKAFRAIEGSGHNACSVPGYIQDTQKDIFEYAKAYNRRLAEKLAL